MFGGGDDDMFEGLLPEMMESCARLFGNRQYPDHKLIAHLEHHKFHENCFDCILKLKKGRKKRLTEFFSNLLDVRNEDYHHETVFRLHSLTNHPEQCSDYGFSFKDLYLMLKESGGFVTLCRLINHKHKKDHFTLESVCYFTISSLGMFCRKEQKELDEKFEEKKVFPTESEVVNYEAAKYFTEIGIVKEMSAIVCDQRSIFEKLKAIHVLRFICWYVPAAKIVHDSGATPYIFNSFRNAQNEILKLYKSKFSKYQLYIACFGTGGTDYTTAVALDEITQEAARDRTLARVYGLKENAGALLGLFGKFNEGITLWETGIVDQHLELLKRNCKKFAEEDIMTSVWMTFGILTENKEQCEKLINRDIVSHIKKWILHQTCVMLIHVLRCLHHLVKYSPTVKKEIVKETLIMHYLIDNIHHCNGRTQIEILGFLLEFLKVKSVVTMLAEVPKESFFELCIIYSKTHSEIGSEFLHAITNYYPNYMSQNHLVHMPNYLREGEKNKSKILKFKEKGNELFKKKEFEKAIIQYDKGINLSNFWGIDTPLPVLLSNRAECNIQLKKYDEAIRDCSKSLSGDLQNIKSIIRFGKALQAKGMVFEALNFFYAANLLSSNNKELVTTIQELEKQLEIPKLCEYCDSYKSDMAKCSCLKVRYCDKNCQTEHWKDHKPHCKK